MGRDSYGRTPWGRWFLEILDSYPMGERLNRGRRYANAGKVLSLICHFNVIGFKAAVAAVKDTGLRGHFFLWGCKPQP